MTTHEGPEFNVGGAQDSPDFQLGEPRAAWWNVFQGGRPAQVCYSTGRSIISTLGGRLTAVAARTNLPQPESGFIGPNTLALMWRRGQEFRLNEFSSPMALTRQVRDRLLARPNEDPILSDYDAVTLTAFVVWLAIYDRPGNTVNLEDVVIRRDANPLPINYPPMDDGSYSTDLVCYLARNDGSPVLEREITADTGAPRLRAAESRGSGWYIAGALAAIAGGTAAARKRRRR